MCELHARSTASAVRGFFMGPRSIAAGLQAGKAARQTTESHTAVRSRTARRDGASRELASVEHVSGGAHAVRAAHCRAFSYSVAAKRRRCARTRDALGTGTEKENPTQPRGHVGFALRRVYSYSSSVKRSAASSFVVAHQNGLIDVYSRPVRESRFC